MANSIPVSQHDHVLLAPAPLTGHQARCSVCGFGLRFLLDTEPQLTITRPGFELVAAQALHDGARRAEWSTGSPR